MPGARAEASAAFWPTNRPSAAAGRRSPPAVGHPAPGRSAQSRLQPARRRGCGAARCRSPSSATTRRGYGPSVCSTIHAPGLPPRQRSSSKVHRGAPETGLSRLRFAGRAGDLPPCRRRRSAGPALAGAAVRPAPDDETGGPAPFARQLQAASRGEIDVFRLADHGGDPGRGQGVLERRQGLGFVTGADLDQLVGGKSETLQPRRIEIVPPHHPNHGALGRQGRGHQRRHRRRRGRGFELQPLARQLMPASERQAAPRQGVVDPGIAERQGAPRRRGRLQRRQARRASPISAPAETSWRRTPFVLILF